MLSSCRWILLCHGLTARSSSALCQRRQANVWQTPYRLRSSTWSPEMASHLTAARESNLRTVCWVICALSISIVLYLYPIHHWLMILTDHTSHFSASQIYHVCISLSLVMYAGLGDWRLWVAARDAVAPNHEWRYSEEQIEYHYTTDQRVLQQCCHLSHS